MRRASSYYESLAALNERLGREGRPPAELVLVPESLEDEDMMDMLNAGLLQYIVVDDWKARMWAQVLPKVKPRNDLVLREGAKTGWAVRKDSPLLKAEIADFFQNWALKNGVADYRMASYMKRVKELKDPTGSAEWKRFKETLAIFEKYGAKYGFDPLMLAAQGYQESQLNQQAKSHVGAIGVMQIMPATGAQLNVGDIRITEPNIHGGAKYMDQLMTKYFPDAKFSEGNRPLFAFASYNCGPGNMSKMRKEAARARARPGPVVQQRRDRRRREDRHRDDDLRAQHLQVLRRVQADARGAGRGGEGARRGRPGEELTARRRRGCRLRRAAARSPAGPRRRRRRSGFPSARRATCAPAGRRATAGSR